MGRSEMSAPDMTMKKAIKQQLIDGTGWGIVFGLAWTTWEFFLFAISRGVWS